MKSVAFPTTVVDDFFYNPLSVRKLALEQEYFNDPQNKWPGKRSKSIHELSPELNTYITYKFLSLFYSLNEQLEWVSDSRFQIVDDRYKDGWVHNDQSLISFIIYLNPDANPDTGTTVYEPINEWKTCINSDFKHKQYESLNNNPQFDFPEFNFSRKQSNKRFEESIVVKNKFNRLVAFDGHLWHGANKFDGSGADPRLTIITFLYKLTVSSRNPHPYPLQRFNQFGNIL